AGDDLEFFVCHEGWSSSDTGKATGLARVDQSDRQYCDGIFGTSSYEVMLGWAARLVRATSRRTDRD
ncbi:hypothetical protein, partial [Glutamicibacter ardleyensis]|uniref:hypothetical protein n=1 Tax=Glutamicibacter ardleyensis TaxID=225894 RepID=UPI003FD30445